MIATFHGAGSSPDKDPGSDSDSDVVEVMEDQGDIAGYAYVGSHNFTPSAWGTLSGSGFTPTLNVSYLPPSLGFKSKTSVQVTNYELGIVFSLRDEADVDRVVCYERPPRRYGSKNRPWVSCFGCDWDSTHEFFHWADAGRE
jgi:tyrosyl-DNA phosphodiesterase 1